MRENECIRVHKNAWDAHECIRVHDNAQDAYENAGDANVCIILWVWKYEYVNGSKWECVCEFEYVREYESVSMWLGEHEYVSASRWVWVGECKKVSVSRWVCEFEYVSFSKWVFALEWEYFKLCICVSISHFLQGSLVFFQNYNWLIDKYFRKGSQLHPLINRCMSATSDSLLQESLSMIVSNPYL